MATIDQIANGEAGLSVRDKLNAVHDQIVEITSDYAQLQADDAIIGTAATIILLDLLSVTAVPPLTPFKSLTVFNLAASANNIVLQPFGAETIDGLSSLVIVPGTVATITPTSTEWVTHNIGIVDSVGGGTNINISGPAEAPVVNLDAAITGISVNGVSLTNAGSSGDFLQAEGGYSLVVKTVTGGTNITNSGTPAAPVLDLDAIITGMTVNGVDLTAAGDTFEYLGEDGQYTVPTGNIVEVTTAYTQVVRDDVIIANSAIAFDVDLIIVSSAVKAITIRNDGTATVTITANVVDNIDGAATVALTAGTSIILVPTSTNDWLEVGEAGIQSVQSGANVTIDNTDPANPIVSLPTDITTQMVNGVSLSGIGSESNFLNEGGGYSVPLSSGAQIAAETVQVFDEADIIAAFGAGPVWTLTDVNLQVMANIVLTTGNGFLIDTTSATVYGVDRNISSLTADATIPLFDFTANSGTNTDLQLRTNNCTFTQSGTGDLLRQDGTRFIVDFGNCGLNGNTTGGNLNLLNGQFIGFRDGVLQGGGSIIQGDGTAANPGVEFIFLTENFLGITDLFADNQRFIELMPNSITRRFSALTFAIQINPDFGFTAQRTGGVGVYIHKSATVEIFNYMGGGFNPLDPSSQQFVVEDPDSIKFGVLGGNVFTGSGDLYGFSSLTPDSTIALASVRGLGVDASGNLLACEELNSASSNIIQYTGLTSTPLDTISSPDNRPADVDWYRGNLISLGFGSATQGIVYLHDGFADLPPVSVSLAPLGFAFARGLTTDGTNIIIVDSIAREISIFGPDFFTATTPVPINTFILPGSGVLNGCSYDGVNLILSDTSDDLILVMKGLTSEIQYTFGAQAANILGVTVTPTGYAESDQVNGDIDIFLESLTFDHSSPTWEIIANTGEREVIPVDPINDTLWTTGNSGTVDDTGAILTLTNGAAAAGFADFPLLGVQGHKYRVTNGYTPGTSVSATFSILDSSLATITSETVSVAGDVELTFIAPEEALFFRIANTSVISGETSVLTSLSSIDESYKIIESSDKGGSIFNDPTARPFSPVLVPGVLSDISDGGTDIFYGPFGQREKSRLDDEITGAIEITSVDTHGQTLQGSFVAMATAAGTNQYELLVTINGIPQEDSVGTNVWIGNNDIRSITTQAITRDVTETDILKLQLRPVITTVNLSVLRCALSHSR